MRAIRVYRFGGPEVLDYEETPPPEPGPGEARVRTEVIGVNFIDIYHRAGRFPTDLPMTPGMEAAGVVDAVGPEVTEVKSGDRVAYAMHLGSYAEQAVVPAWKLVPISDDLDTRMAAAVMLQGMTAHYLTHSAYALEEGDTVLIHAAAGGVGQLLVQMAKRRGTRVIGTVSTEDKARLAREAGADKVILYTQVDFEEKLKRLTGGTGVDVVYDSVGRTTFEHAEALGL